MGSKDAAAFRFRAHRSAPKRQRCNPDLRPSEIRELTAPKLTTHAIVILPCVWLALASAVSVQPPVDSAEQRDVAAIAANIRRHAGRSATSAYQVTIPNTTVSYHMVPIPTGDFLMGSPASNPHRAPDEEPSHRVHVNAFWMQAHEVTWDEYRLFMFAAQSTPATASDKAVDGITRPTRPYVDMSFGMGINGYPAISMTEHAANKYAEWLSARTGEFYRLPTEAEWEYACRGGTNTPYYFGSDTSKLSEHAWFKGNSGGRYHKVATKGANPWGLYDMLGNVMEWTLDQYAPYLTATDALSQSRQALLPWVKPTKPYPITVRGGSWADPAEELRCAARVPSDPSWKRQDPQLPKSIWYETDAPWLGFRLIRPAKVPSDKEMYAYWNNGVAHDEQ